MCVLAKATNYIRLFGLMISFTLKTKIDMTVYLFFSAKVRNGGRRGSRRLRPVSLRGPLGLARNSDAKVGKSFCVFGRVEIDVVFGTSGRVAISRRRKSGLAARWVLVAEIGQVELGIEHVLN